MRIMVAEVPTGGGKVWHDLTPFTDDITSLEVIDSMASPQSTCSFNVKFPAPPRPAWLSKRAELYILDDTVPGATWGQATWGNFVWGAQNRVFGGYISRLTSTTTTNQPAYQVEAQDYSLLTRRIINVRYKGWWDGDVVADILTRQLHQLTSVPVISAANTVQVKDVMFTNILASDAIATLEQMSGSKLRFDWYGRASYGPVTYAASPAPFGISTRPDLVTSFPLWAWEYDEDYSVAYDGVLVEGGTFRAPAQVYLAGDGHAMTFFSQQSPYPEYSEVWGLDDQGNSNTTWNTYTIGTQVQTGYDVIVDQQAQSWSFLNAPAAPPNGAPVVSGKAVNIRLTYTYDVPILLPLRGHNAPGLLQDYLHSDGSICTMEDAGQMASSDLATYQDGARTAGATVLQRGVRSGQVIQVDHFADGVHDTFLVQEVRLFHTGAQTYPGDPLAVTPWAYELTLGTYQPTAEHLLANALANLTQQAQTQTMPPTAIGLAAGLGVHAAAPLVYRPKWGDGVTRWGQFTWGGQ